jgi:flagellar basal-body rod modification protein FlgD
MDLSLLNTVTNAAGAAGSSRLATALAPKAATVTAKDNSGTSTDGSSSSNSTTDNTNITADDFLTLLVSELKNQDPTQPADPTQYISQLVGVNSLQQLIQINQGLSTFEGAVIG